MGIHSEVIDGIVAELETIVEGQSAASGHVYNFTPKKVMRVPHFLGLGLAQKADPGPFYFVRDSGEEITSDEVRSFEKDAYAADVPILVAMRDERGEKDPFRDAVSSGVIQDKMVDDVIACLRSDERRGNAGIFQTTIPTVDRDTFDVLQGWVLAWLFFNVEYETEIGDR